MIINLGNTGAIISNTWVSPLVSEIVKLNPHHVTIITNQTETAYQHGIVKTLTENIPTVSVTIKETALTHSNSSLTSRVFSKSSDTTVYLILYELENNNKYDYFEQLHYFFHYVSKLSVRYTRPKCLLLVITHKHVLKDYLRRIFHYAWQRKFLDVTILEVHINDKVEEAKLIKHFYNPFNYGDKNFSVEPWNSESTLFPEKLLNMNGYRLKIPLYYSPPYISTTRNKNGSVKEIIGTNYEYTKILAQFLNFSMDFNEEVKTKKFSAIIEALTQLLNDNKVDMLPVPAYSYYFNQDFETSITFGYRNYVALIPVLQYQHIILPNSLLGNFLLGCVLLLVITLIIHLLKFERKYWNPMDNMRLLLGLSVPYEPRKAIERSFFLVILMISMTYSPDIFSKLMDVKVKSDEKSYNTFEDIGNSDLNIFIQPVAFDKVFPPDEASSQKIKAKIGNAVNTPDCIRKLHATQNYACITSRDRAGMWMKMYQRQQDASSMKIGKPEIAFDFVSYTFEKSSPYVKRFNEIIYRIFESGVWKIWGHTKNSADHVVSKAQATNEVAERSVLALQLGGIMMAGCAISIVAFGVEFLAAYICKLTKRYHVHEVRRDTQKNLERR